MGLLSLPSAAGDWHIVQGRDQSAHSCHKMEFFSRDVKGQGYQEEYFGEGISFRSCSGTVLKFCLETNHEEEWAHLRFPRV